MANSFKLPYISGHNNTIFRYIRYSGHLLPLKGKKGLLLGQERFSTRAQQVTKSERVLFLLRQATSLTLLVLNSRVLCLTDDRPPSVYNVHVDFFIIEI
jgi:hypothetical protein